MLWEIEIYIKMAELNFSPQKMEYDFREKKNPRCLILSSFYFPVFSLMKVEE